MPPQGGSPLTPSVRGGFHTTVPLLQRRCHMAGPHLSALVIPNYAYRQQF